MGTLDEGAKAVVEHCMRIGPEDSVVIIGDDASKEVSLAIRKAVLEVTGKVRFFNLDLSTYGGRPLAELPNTIREAARAATATFFLAAPMPKEQQSVRIPFINEAIKSGRHAHMMGIKKEVMENVMAVDFTKVAEFTRKLSERLSVTNMMHVTSKAGTDLMITYPDGKGWVSCMGVCDEPGQWESFPSGEVYAAVMSMSGRLVVDGPAGSFLGEKYTLEDMKETPVILDVKAKDEGSYITGLQCDNEDMKEDFENFLLGPERCAGRAGLIGFGTNIFLEEYYGNITVDGTYPGFHVSFGDPLHVKTGANWVCKHQMYMCLRNCTVSVNGKAIMKDGKYTKDILKGV